MANWLRGFHRGNPSQLLNFNLASPPFSPLDPPDVFYCHLAAHILPRQCVVQQPWKMDENGPFIDGLPITNGDFPWLC